MFERMLLAVDGSTTSMDAARAAGELARQMKSEVLRVVVVLDGVPGHAGNLHSQQERNERLKEAQAMLRRACQVVGDIPGLVHCELTEGPAAQAINSIAHMRESTVILMASQDPEEVAELILEGNAQRARGHGSCPILLVR